MSFSVGFSLFSYLFIDQLCQNNHCIFVTSCLDYVKYDKDEKSLLKSTRIFPLISRQCTSCLQFFNYSPNTQEIYFTCLRSSWINIFTCYLGSKVPELYNGCNSCFNRCESVCQINFLSGIYNFFHCSIGWKSKRDLSLRIKIKFKRVYLGLFFFKSTSWIRT